jgi:polyisoprenoid-binding protein YceI
MIRRAAAIGCLSAALLATASAGTAQVTTQVASRPSETGTKWVVDPVHSQIDFRVRHLVGRVRGTFTRWYGVLVTDGEDWTHGTVRVSVQTASLNTGNAYRDADLRSKRFFAVDSFPQMTFEGNNIATTDSTVTIGGTLTIKGHPRPVVLSGQYRGIARDGEGHQRIAFDASTVVDRRDYGIEWNEIVDGSRMIGNDVEITIAIEAVRVP